MARKPKVVVTSLPFPVSNSEETTRVPVPNARLEWMLDPYKDESELAHWICWDSKCGRYRIVLSFHKYDNSKLYRAGVLKGGAVSGIITSDAKSLRSAIESAERHHCKNHKLEGVESNAESVIQRHEENLGNNSLDNLIPSRYSSGQSEGQRGTSTNSSVKENVMKVDAKVAVSLVEQLGLTKAKDLIKEEKADKVVNFLKNMNNVYDPEDEKTTINGDKENVLLEKLLKLKEGEEIELTNLKSLTKEEKPEGEEKVSAKASKGGKTAAAKPSKNSKVSKEKNKQNPKKSDVARQAKPDSGEPRKRQGRREGSAGMKVLGAIKREWVSLGEACKAAEVDRSSMHTNFMKKAVSDGLLEQTGEGREIKYRSTKRK